MNKIKIIIIMYKFKITHLHIHFKFEVFFSEHGSCTAIKCQNLNNISFYIYQRFILLFTTNEHNLRI